MVGKHWFPILVLAEGTTQSRRQKMQERLVGGRQEHNMLSLPRIQQGTHQRQKPRDAGQKTQSLAKIDPDDKKEQK